MEGPISFTLINFVNFGVLIIYLNFLQPG